MKQRISRGRKSDRGAAVVEFALVVPILLTFLLGVIEYGNYFMTDLRVTNGAMTGARAYAIKATGSWQADAVGIAGTGYTFTPTDNCASALTTLPARSVQVQAVGTYKKLFGGIIPTPANVTGRGVVRCER